MTQTQPITAVTAGTHPDPYPFYAGLVADRPFGQDGDLWVAAGAAVVTEVLTNADCRVRPGSEPVPRGLLGTPAGEVFGRLVRMTDGPDRDRMKTILREVLGTLDDGRVHQVAADGAARARDWSDAQFGVPARTVATLLGLSETDSIEAARLIGDFVRCLPGSATAEDQAAAGTAAAALFPLLAAQLTDSAPGLLGELAWAAERHGFTDRDVLIANALGLLSQTYDATAGLIGNTLLALGVRGTPDDLCAFTAEVARHDAPIQNTRRFTAADVVIAGQRVPEGSPILLLLAAANRDPSVNPDPHTFRPDRSVPSVFTFSDGPHTCPGRALATAITVGVVGSVTVAPTHDGYRPSPNARIPILRGQPR